MNSTIRHLFVAAPLATAAIAFAPAAAMAAGPDPVVVIPSDTGHPQGPTDIAAPKPGPVGPKGPGDLDGPKPGPVGPKGPGDLDGPKPGPVGPKGPGDLSGPKPCPTHGADCSGGKGGKGGKGGDGPSDQPGRDSEIPVPGRIDAGTASSEGGLELAWLLAGGAVVTASGTAFAARNLARRHA